jgi:hypothetical protein
MSEAFIKTPAADGFSTVVVILNLRLTIALANYIKEKSQGKEKIMQRFWRFRHPLSHGDEPSVDGG